MQVCHYKDQLTQRARFNFIHVEVKEKIAHTRSHNIKLKIMLSMGLCAKNTQEG